MPGHVLEMPLVQRFDCIPFYGKDYVTILYHQLCHLYRAKLLNRDERVSASVMIR